MNYLITGSPIYTLDVDYGVVQAMVVKDGLVAAVGERKTLQNQYPDARKVDLEGGAVIPAFNDCHAHLLLLGQDLMRCNLMGCTTRAQVLAALLRWQDKNPSSPWIMGWNFDAANYREALPLSCTDLNEVSRHQPVIISDQTKHAVMVNSAAMEQAGISADTTDPKGGMIERNPSGNPTGVFREMAAMELMESAVPDPGVEGICRALGVAMDYLEKKGILAATESLAGNWYPLAGKISAYNRVLEKGGPVRITLLPEFISAQKAGWLEREAIACLHLHEDLRIGPLKLMADGAISARTAALTLPYENSTSLGHLTLEGDELDRRVRMAQQAGWATATHAIGDRAIQVTINAIEKARQDCARPGLRHRIEHAILLDARLCQRLAALEIMISAQPQLLLDMGDNHFAALGDRSFSEKPYLSLLQAGVLLGFGSDLPVVDGDPIPGWRAAVNRQTRAGMVLGRQEGLSPLTALECYTKGSAALGRDTALGTLAPGKQARFVVLSHRPELIAEEDIKVVEVSSRIMANHMN
ncbi:MAG: amidohydrolase [Pseudomonadota bacterium]